MWQLASRAHARILVVLSITLLGAACSSDPKRAHGGGGGGGGSAEPSACELGCPEGYRCEAGVCAAEEERGLALDLHTVPVSGVLLLDGAPPKETSSCTDLLAFLEFVEPTSGSLVRHSIRCGTGAAFAVDLTPGTWIVTMRSVFQSSSNLPFQPVLRQLLLENALVVSGPMTGVQLDLRPVRISGVLRRNGTLPTVSAGCTGEVAVVVFTEAGSGATVAVPIYCQTTDFAFHVDLPPGTYSVAVGSIGGGSDLPDGYVVLDPAFEVSGPISELLFDLRTVHVAGTLLLNGAQPEVGRTCTEFSSAITFTEKRSGAALVRRIPCADAAFSFDAELPPGEYAVSVATDAPGTSNLPEGAAVVDPALRITDETSDLRLDLRTLPVSGELLYMGRSFDVMDTCTADVGGLTFYGKETGTRIKIVLPCDPAGTRFHVELPIDTYTVIFRAALSRQTELPQGAFVVEPALQVTAPVSGLDLNLWTVRVSGTLLLDGERLTMPTDCSGKMATVHFVGEKLPVTSDELLSVGPQHHAYVDINCRQGDFDWSLDLQVGEYLVGVEQMKDGVNPLPKGQYAMVQRLLVQ